MNNNYFATTTTTTHNNNNRNGINNNSRHNNYYNGYNNNNNHRMREYSWPCQCGGTYSVLYDETAVHDDSTEELVLPCSTCSLHIQVVL